MKLATKILAMLIIIAFTITVIYLPSPVRAFGACADARSSCEAGCSGGDITCLRGCAAKYNKCCAETSTCPGAEDPEAPPES